MPSPSHSEHEAEFIRAFDDALTTRLQGHRQAFDAKHQQVTVAAGPQLFKSDQSVEYWTFDHGKRAITECTADIVHEAIAYAEANRFSPELLYDSAEAGLNGFTEYVVTELDLELKRIPVNEHGLTPSPLALEGVRRHAEQIVRGGLGSIRRGIADPRLGRAPQSIPFYQRAFGHYWPLLFALVVFALLMFLSF